MQLRAEQCPDERKWQRSRQRKLKSMHVFIYASAIHNHVLARYLEPQSVVSRVCAKCKPYSSSMYSERLPAYDDADGDACCFSEPYSLKHIHYSFKLADMECQ